MLTEIGRLEQIEFRYVYGSWSQGLQRLQNGEIDVMPSVAYTPEREIVMDYASQPLLTVWGELYVPQGSAIVGIMDARGKKIAVMKGDVNARHFKKLAEDFKLGCQFVEFPDFNEVFVAIQANKVDAGVVNNTFGAPKYKEFGLQASGIIFNPFDIFFAVKKDTNADILKITDRYLSLWKNEESSVYNRSRQKWSHGNIGTIEIMPQWLSISIAVFAICLVVAGIFILLLKLQVSRAVAKIKESESKLRSYIDNAPDGVCVIGSDGTIQETNQALCSITGRTGADLEKMLFRSIFSPEDALQTDKWLGNLAVHRTCRAEGHLLHGSGDDIWVMLDAVRLDASRVLIFMKDISDKKKAELTLRDRAAEIEEQNAELLIAKLKAEESDRLKNAFLQNLNHEIRTPLNAIMGFSELLPMLITGNDKAEEYCRFIVQRGHDLLEIINGTLLIASLESYQIYIEQDTIMMSQLISELETEFEAMQVRYKKENLRFTVCDSICNDVAVQTDVAKLKIILSNLLSNACKFTLTGSVEVCITQIHDTLLRIEVRDSGIGIHPDKQSHIFSRFYKIIDSAAPMYDGAGLGLPIAKSLTEMLGGTMDIVSVYGKGSVFGVTIPCIILPVPSDTADEQPAAQQHEAVQVLVVEDDLYNMIFLSQLLEHWGFAVLTATTAEQGIQRAINEDVSLVLMDIKLPDMPGYEAATQIKKVKPNLQIIAQTGYSSSQDAQHAYQSGMDDYISKPILLTEFKALMQKYLPF